MAVLGGKSTYLSVLRIIFFYPPPVTILNVPFYISKKNDPYWQQVSMSAFTEIQLWNILLLLHTC